jgi:hypothetical protein
MSLINTDQKGRRYKVMADYKKPMKNIIRCWFDCKNKIISESEFLKIVDENVTETALKEAYEIYQNKE